MIARRNKALAILSASALGAVVAVLSAVPASAENLCWATASGNYTYDHASTYQPSGTCKYHKIQGQWYIIGDPHTPYFESGTRNDVPPGGTKYVGYTLPSQYQLQQYRWCTHTSLYACSYGSWET